jgi:hypothetical protein
MLKFTHRPVYVLCFDGEDGGDGGGDPNAAGDPGTAGNHNADAGGGGGDKTFTQTELNEFLARDKRKHQERYQQLEAEHKQLLQNQNLTKEDRDKLEARLADLQAQNRTKDQQAEFERKKAREAHEAELEEARQAARMWEGKYKTETVVRALQDAASSADAYNPSHIVQLLRPDTELKEVDGELVPMVNFADIDEKTGDNIRTLCSPADAVKRMQQLPKIHGNLFKSNVVAGVGAGQADVSNAGDVDYSTMTHEDYRKNREAIKRRLSR